VTVRRVAELAPVPLIFAAGACCARVWLPGVAGPFQTDLAQPFVIVTAWGSAGATAFAIFAATIASAAVALVLAGRRHVRAAAAHETQLVIAIAAIAIAAAFAWPFAFSSDVYAYAAYGAMLRDGFDPYVLLPRNVHGAFYDAARLQWSGPFPVCVYGPMSVAIAFSTVAGLGKLGVGSVLLALRLGTALAFLGSIALLGYALRGHPRARTFALYAYGLNPVVLWSVAEGHNDAWLLLAAVGSLTLLRRHPAAGAFFLGLTLLVKAPGAAFALAVAADPLLPARRRAGVFGGALAGVVLAASLWLPLMRPAFAAIGGHGRYAPLVSVQGLAGPAAAGILAALAVAYGGSLLLSGSRRGYAWLGIAAIVALPNGYPWYALWLVPFALAAGSGPAAVALWVATIFSAVRYLPDAVGTLDSGSARIAALVATVPLLYALTDIRFVAFRKKAPVQP
jgi:hypothetical protein